MSVVVIPNHGGVQVVLGGIDRLMNWRRSFEFHFADVATVSVVERRQLEQHIDHRSLGLGTHAGARRPDRRRVGTMLGRGVAGKQWWAVEAGDPAQRLLVLDFTGHEFARAVLAVDSPDRIAADWQGQTQPTAADES